MDILPTKCTESQYFHDYIMGYRKSIQCKLLGKDRSHFLTDIMIFLKDDFMKNVTKLEAFYFVNKNIAIREKRSGYNFVRPGFLPIPLRERPSL